jgi:dihydrodipicolinate synthase/N-acetylneuraminate lyase
MEFSSQTGLNKLFFKQKGFQMLRGIVPIIPTPFNESEELDLEALRRFIDFAVRSRVAAVCLPAYGSEFYKLTDAERSTVIKVAVEQANRRVPVIAQSNHPCTRSVVEIARRNESLGADVISFALPRQFALQEEELLRFSAAVCRAVSVPVLIQDFNPGGPSVDANFTKRLQEESGNFRYLKLEEPLMGAKVQSIRKASQDRIGIFEGWGGMYLLELIPYGISGTVPGLAMCDLFGLVFDLFCNGSPEKAMHIYHSILPQIVFCLQNMELYHHCEKRLLRARGLLEVTTVRHPSYCLDPHMEAHIDLLNRAILSELDRQGLRT